MLKEEVAASRRNSRQKHWIRTSWFAGTVCILGMAAYLLFTWINTEPNPVNARQVSPPQSPALPPQSFTSASINQATVPALPNESAPTPSPMETVPFVDSLDLLARASAVLANASPEQQATAQKLLAFTQTGAMADISELTRNDVEVLADYLTEQLGPETIAAALESKLGLPSALFLSQENPAEIAADLFEAVQNEGEPTAAQAVIFSDQVETDGTVTGNVHVIPAGTKRVYAAFENAAALHGLDSVLAVWRNPADETMVFTEYEPLHSGSVYNYVWLDLEEGWPAGYYQLDLFHPTRASELLASRSFNVR